MRSPVRSSSRALGAGGGAATADDDGMSAAVGWLSAQQDTTSGLVRSFAIPADDPDRALAPLSFTYDDALAAIAFTAVGDTRRAARVLDGLSDLQAVDGSLPFAYDTSAGVVASEMRRSGTLACGRATPPSASSRRPATTASARSRPGSPTTS